MAESGSKFSFNVEPWSIVKENKEYQTPIFNLLKRKLRLESEGHEGTFYILEVPTWVNVVALTPDEKVILVEQYRFGSRKASLEIPGGVCDDGEEPLETARRELMEETGYVSEKWTGLGKVSANPAIQDNSNYFFLAEECHPGGETNFDQHERILIHELPYEEFLDRVKDGTIDHSIVVAAVAKLLLSDVKRET